MPFPPPIPFVVMIALMAATPAVLMADTPVHRFTLVVGANSGGAERPRLQYAVADAERFARVLTELGGVSPANEILLKQPKIGELTAAFDRLAARVSEVQRTRGGGRTEVLVYYSGHADERGLLIGDDRYSYRTLRDRLDQIPADVRIAVLDACASGAFTRIKSGRARPAFTVDEASNMRGHAFLTSSAATEAAQESDRIRASYFTHYLVSGFRGAADHSSDGKVTLNEAYQFAFNETLGRTVDTKAGPQHPSYDINLSGTGDVVMTDLRQTTSTLVIGEEMEGRFFIRNARQELVAELYKPRGRRVELGVEPESYEVRLEVPKSVRLAKAEIGDGARVMLDPARFGAVALEPTRRRGDEAGPDLAVDNRHRVSARIGRWYSDAGGASLNGVAGLEYTRYVREDLQLVVGMRTLYTPGAWLPQIDLANPTVTVPGNTTYLGAGKLRAIPIVVRWNPATRGREQRAIKPFVAAGFGPVFGSGSVSTFVNQPQFAQTSREQYRETAGLLHVGAGLDFHLSRGFVVGVDVGYNMFFGGFSRPIGADWSYSMPEFGLNLGWVFGGRKAPSR
jgi:hypothetical protein